MLILSMIIVIKFLVSTVNGDLPSFEDLENPKYDEASIVYDTHGVPFGKYYVENREIISFDELSPTIIDALIATEDVRYYRHTGVDLKALFRVAFKTVLMGKESSGGGSTITQQLAKNLYPRGDYGKGSLVINKIKEVLIARRLEKLYTKEEILELYLNTVPFSENTYGIKVASNHFFKTTPDKLNPSQSAVLVAMLKATSTYNPVSKPKRSKQRRDLVLRQMAKYGYLNKVVAKPDEQ